VRFFFFKKTLSRGKSISPFVEEKRGSVLRSRYTSEVASFLPPALERKYLSLSPRSLIKSGLPSQLFKKRRRRRRQRWRF